MKKNTILKLILITPFLLSCAQSRERAKSWTHDTALFVEIAKENVDVIFPNISTSFKKYQYRDAFVFQKVNQNFQPLNLVFVCDSKEEKELLKDELRKDERNFAVTNETHLPIGPDYDTQHIEIEKDTLNIGETTIVEFKGSSYKYTEPFSFNSFFINTDSNIDKICARFNNIKDYEISPYSSWIKLNLTTNNYFELIKTMDEVVMFDTSAQIIVDQSNMALGIAPPLFGWIVSDPNIAKIVERDPTNGKKIKVQAIASGKTIIKYSPTLYSVELTVK
mgnify:CR=1 FL=1